MRAHIQHQSTLRVINGATVRMVTGARVGTASRIWMLNNCPLNRVRLLNNTAAQPRVASPLAPRRQRLCSHSRSGHSGHGAASNRSCLEAAMAHWRRREESVME